MKKNILLVLAVMILVRCGYLDDYSQDMVVVKSVSDLDEVLLGSVYIPSKEEVQDLAWGDIGWWLHILDDDINTVITDQAENRIWNSAMNSAYFGYTTWRWEGAIKEMSWLQIMPFGMIFIAGSMSLILFWMKSKI